MRLIVRDLRKKFDDITVIDRAGYDFESGVVYGITGSRGSGRTTLLKCLCTECAPDGGFIRLDTGNGYYKIDYMDFGLVYDKPVLPEMLTARQYVEYMISMHAPQEHNAAKYLEIVGISRGRTDEYIGSFSDDEKQRLQFISILITEPVVVLIDEPNLDGKMYNTLKDFIARMKDKHIIIISSDNYKKLDTLVDELVWLKDGILTGGLIQEKR